MIKAKTEGNGDDGRLVGGGGGGRVKWEIKFLICFSNGAKTAGRSEWKRSHLKSADKKHE